MQTDTFKLIVKWSILEYNKQRLVNRLFIWFSGRIHVCTIDVKDGNLTYTINAR